ncbi:hypothetical protein TrCOL_g9541 [Triparma columacea]|uniref:Uncharacterized protein n=1 Tax=Triparma columacea TaxID=722753 RepID=A0A9W7G8Z4_9STRA|nr:hypothetical protein TrCOL_g9541 [Triparma columacea]
MSVIYSTFRHLILSVACDATEGEDDEAYVTFVRENFESVEGKSKGVLGEEAEKVKRLGRPFTLFQWVFGDACRKGERDVGFPSEVDAFQGLIYGVCGQRFVKGVDYNEIPSIYMGGDVGGVVGGFVRGVVVVGSVKEVVEKVMKEEVVKGSVNWHQEFINVLLTTSTLEHKRR